MVVRRRLVASSEDRARRIVALHDFREVLRKQRLHGELTFLRQRRGVVAGIEDEVRLFEGECVGLSRRPLLKHLVANRPHQDAGVVTVTKYQVRQVALMPLVEEAGIVILRLLTSPHVEALVHHDESHRVAHVQQFRSRRVVGTADGVHTHGLQFGELAVQGIFIQCSTQATEVVMLADTVELEVLAIEPEACLWVEPKTPKACRSLIVINHLAVDSHFRAYLIYIRGLARPKHRLRNVDDRLQSLRCPDYLTVRVDE